MSESFKCGDKPDSTNSLFRFGYIEQTLQSIDDTLKRLEKIMIRVVENQFDEPTDRVLLEQK